MDKNFDKLEIWTLRNVFALGRGKGGDEGLGEWVRLGHYEVCVLTATLSLRGTKKGRGGEGEVGRGLTRRTESRTPAQRFETHSRSPLHSPP